jgi:hypothetical protein
MERRHRLCGAHFVLALQAAGDIKEMKCLLNILDNTFIGTTLAGVILAYVGVGLYRKQKDIDSRYEDAKLIKDKASLLFADLDIAAKNYAGHINIFNGKNPGLRNLYDQLTARGAKPDIVMDMNKLSAKVTEDSDNLFVQLKIQGGYESEIESMSKEIPAINLCLAGTMVFPRLTPSDITEQDKLFSEKISLIKGILQRLMKIDVKK